MDRTNREVFRVRVSCARAVLGDISGPRSNMAQSGPYTAPKSGRRRPEFGQRQSRCALPNMGKRNPKRGHLHRRHHIARRLAGRTVGAAAALHYCTRGERDSNHLRRSRAVAPGGPALSKRPRRYRRRNVRVGWLGLVLARECAQLRPRAPGVVAPCITTMAPPKADVKEFGKSSDTSWGIFPCEVLQEMQVPQVGGGARWAAKSYRASSQRVARSLGNSAKAGTKLKYAGKWALFDFFRDFCGTVQRSWNSPKTSPTTPGGLANPPKPLWGTFRATVFRGIL